jgi:hypothetical protein
MGAGRRAMVLRALWHLIPGLLSLMTLMGTISRRARGTRVLFPFFFDSLSSRSYNTRSVSFSPLCCFIFFPLPDICARSPFFCWLVGDSLHGWPASHGSVYVCMLSLELEETVITLRVVRERCSWVHTTEYTRFASPSIVRRSFSCVGHKKGQRISLHFHVLLHDMIHHAPPPNAEKHLTSWLLFK